MPKVTATGIYQGNRISVEAFKKAGSILLLVDGFAHAEIQNDFQEKLLTAPAMGGTYHPDPNSLLAAYSVLESSFFDKGTPVEVKAEGDIGTIPTYNIRGIVY
jgi:hypothetical protein